MTGEHKRAHIAAELARGEQALEAAKELLGLLNDAVSRAYYAAAHFARALLLTEGVEPKTHVGPGRMLGLHFIVPGKLPPDRAKDPSRLELFRNEADYNRFFVFSPEGAADEGAVAERFCDAARRWLADNGWT